MPQLTQITYFSVPTSWWGTINLYARAHLAHFDNEIGSILVCQCNKFFYFRFELWPQNVPGFHRPPRPIVGQLMPLFLTPLLAHTGNLKSRAIKIAQSHKCLMKLFIFSYFIQPDAHFAAQVLIKNFSLLCEPTAVDADAPRLFCSGIHNRISLPGCRAAGENRAGQVGKPGGAVVHTNCLCIDNTGL